LYILTSLLSSNTPQHIYDPLTDWITENVEEKYRRIYPWPVWSFKNRVAQLSRFILVSEFLVDEWADHFKGKTEDDIVEIAKSFSFENSVKREGLNKVLTEHAASVEKK